MRRNGKRFPRLRQAVKGLVTLGLIKKGMDDMSTPQNSGTGWDIERSKVKATANLTAPAAGSTIAGMITAGIVALLRMAGVEITNELHALITSIVALGAGPLYAYIQTMQREKAKYDTPSKDDRFQAGEKTGFARVTTCVVTALVCIGLVLLPACQTTTTREITHPDGSVEVIKERVTDIEATIQTAQVLTQLAQMSMEFYKSIADDKPDDPEAQDDLEQAQARFDLIMGWTQQLLALRAQYAAQGKDVPKNEIPANPIATE